MHEMLQLTRKEFRAFFASPAAYLFIGAFLAVSLFVFFWVETFFARNIADVRPLFQWLPLLLIFLVAALTMRSWSEERRAGTLETLLTVPVSTLSLVLGKFAATLAMVVLALLLTLPLTFSVAMLGTLDWGPVFGGYLATIFLAAAYVAIGLYASSRTDNPIVSLILTAVICGAFYLIGSSTLTSLFGHQIGNLLELFGTGARFESITRGVIDLGDLYYYLSLVGIFLTLNLLGIEQLRWAGNPSNARHRQWRLLALLLVANFIVANFWLTPLNSIRLDLTAGKQYSLSPATIAQLEKMREPLQIRGYFSAKTHPLLSPLVPQIRDILEEYAVAADGRATVEFVDPQQDREAEEEAASRFGIRPVPFQTADRYQAAVVNSYFDIVVSYGDEYETIGFRDLIDVKARNEQNIDVFLKNPEYQITRAIRKVAGAYQTAGNPFGALNKDVTFNAYFSDDADLPPALVELRQQIEQTVSEISEESQGRLKFNAVDPQSGDGELARELSKHYGLQPQVSSLLDPKPFWFHMLLSSSNESVQVPLPEKLEAKAVRRSIESALRRMAPGFLKTVVVVQPERRARTDPGYSKLNSLLTESVRLKEGKLSDGHVPEDADLLLVLSPKQLEDKQRFAIDQFLMQGGSVILTTSPFEVNIGNSVEARHIQSGLEEWLQHYGISIDSSFVLDPQNTALPVPVDRNIGGISLREIQMMPYPHFPDLRDERLNPDSLVTASLRQLTLNWPSPISLDEKLNAERKQIPLLYSSAASWTSDSLNLVPDFLNYPDSGFKVVGEPQRNLLAVALEGRFDSFYAGKPSPLAKSAEDEAKAAADEKDKQDADKQPSITSVIERSPESARLLVIASSGFATDASIDITSQSFGSHYKKSIEFIQNAIDWSLEDSGLLSLRGRTQLARTLDPSVIQQRRLWEYLNYGFALLGLLLIWLWRRRVNSADQKRYQRILAEV